MVRKRDCKLMTKMKKHFKKSLPNNIKTIVTYQSKKLFKKFYVKDETNFCYKNNLVHHGKCSSENFRHDYIGETDRRIEKRIINQNKRDKNSCLPRNVCEMEHYDMWEECFKIS